MARSLRLICIFFAGGRKILQHGLHAAIFCRPKYLDLQLWSTFRNLSFGRIDTYFERCGILRKYVLRNSPQSKKLKGNLPIGQLVSHPPKKVTKANRRKEFSCSCRELSWKAYGVDALSALLINTHSIGSDCHWLFYCGSRKNYEWLSTILPS